MPRLFTRWLPSRLTLRSHLLALVLVTLVPVLVFSVALVVALARHERETVERGSRETARALSLAVDQQIDGAIAALSTLALSSRLGTGDLKGFYDEAAALKASQPGWETVSLHDLRGEGVLNVRLPLGEALPPTPDQEPLRRLVETREPVVSDVQLGRLLQHHVLVILVPVVVRGELRYALGASVDFQQRLAPILARQRLPAEWTATVFDRRKIIVARTRGAEKLVGKPVTAALAKQSNAAAEGWYEDVTLDGIPVYAAFSRSSASGLTVAIGVPAQQVNAALRKSLFAIVGAGLSFLVLAGALAILVGRRIAGSIESLSPAARALARGVAPPARAPSPGIEEVEGVARDLSDAAAILAERAAERTRVEEERARLLARAEAARAEAEVANRAKDEFLATVSHELRTPLTAMLGWARMLRSGRLDGEARTRGLEVLERNARQQAQLIEDLLDVSRIITGKLRLDIRPIELAPVIDAALDAVRGAGETKGIRLETSVAPDLGLVRGDPDRLQQILWNVLSNAIKFTPSSGRVTLTASRRGREVTLIVKDTGKGIEPDFLPFMFDRFRQSENSRGGGLGLGLALVRHLTELHGGTVAAHSDGPGRGATLTVRLPIALAHESSAEPTAPRGTTFPSLAGVRVLVVDDDEDARQLLAIILQQCGAEATTASSTREALERVEDAKPDVVVSDINMPERDGYSLVRELRERGGMRVPIVALTASARGEDRHRALTAGFDVHVAKPVEPAALAEIVAQLAGRVRAARAGRAATGRV